MYFRQGGLNMLFFNILHIELAFCRRTSKKIPQTERSMILKPMTIFKCF